MASSDAITPEYREPPELVTWHPDCDGRYPAMPQMLQIFDRAKNHVGVQQHYDLVTYISEPSSLRFLAAQHLEELIVSVCVANMFCFVGDVCQLTPVRERFMYTNDIMSTEQFAFLRSTVLTLVADLSWMLTSIPL